MRLTDDEIERAELAAGQSYRRHTSSIKGQIVTPADGYEWHLIHSIQDALIAKYAPLVEAAINMVEVKGRHHSEIAMKRLIEAVRAYKEEQK
jgi:hypothetical protein